MNVKEIIDNNITNSINIIEINTLLKNEYVALVRSWVEPPEPIEPPEGGEEEPIEPVEPPEPTPEQLLIYDDMIRLLAIWESSTEQTDEDYLEENKDLVGYQTLIFEYTKIKNTCNNVILPYLNTTVSNELISGDFSNINQYFIRSDRVNDLLIQYSDMFKNENFIDKYLLYKENISTLIINNTDTLFETNIELNTWFDEVKTVSDSNITIFNQIRQYFEELKKVIVVIKIADRLKSDSLESEGMYNTRSILDKQKIDILTDYPTKKEYDDAKKLLIYNLKLEDPLELE